MGLGVALKWSDMMEARIGGDMLGLAFTEYAIPSHISIFWNLLYS